MMELTSMGDAQERSKLVENDDDRYENEQKEGRDTMKSSGENGYEAFNCHGIHEKSIEEEGNR